MATSTCVANVAKGWCETKNEKMEDECYMSCGLCGEYRKHYKFLLNICVWQAKNKDIFIPSMSGNLNF